VKRVRDEEKSEKMGENYGKEGGKREALSEEGRL